MYSLNDFECEQHLDQTANAAHRSLNCLQHRRPRTKRSRTIFLLTSSQGQNIFLPRFPVNCLLKIQLLSILILEHCHNSVYNVQLMNDTKLSPCKLYKKHHQSSSKITLKHNSGSSAFSNSPTNESHSTFKMLFSCSSSCQMLG